MHGHSDLVETLIKPKAYEASTTLLETLQDLQKEFTQKQHRLKTFRQEKQKHLTQLANGEIENNPALDNVDMFSDTTSMATTRFTGTMSGITSLGSRSSVRTARTAKARRKAERKRATGRDKVFEDEYLVNCLSKIVKRSNDMRGKKKKKKCL